MNRLIKDLADQAGLITYAVGFGGNQAIKNEAEIDKFVSLIMDECYDIVSKSDPSPKMILHEPYRSILSRLEHHLQTDSDE